jgi:putative ABC transport system permease protein
MNMRNLLITAARSLSRNKMRSALTSLGIIIGVASVIMMVGIGNSARIAVREKVFTFGSNAMAVESPASPFTDRDVETLRRTIPLIKNITPVASRSKVTAKYQSRFILSRISGVDNDFFEIKEWPLQYGRYFADVEVIGIEKVAIIGNTARLELFGYTDPVGNVILVNNIPFKVIGSLTELGQAFSGRDQDNVIIVPYTTAGIKLIGRRTFEEIFISTYSETLVDKTAAEIRNFLRLERAIPPDKGDDFRIRTSKEKLEMAEYISKTLAILLAGIASISLIVGGIGIMNIMLVSVSERTREIGIRMAIGARKRDILIQFLIEAITLSAGGGSAGIVIGLVLYFVITVAVGWPFYLSFFSVIIAFMFSCAVGVFFGYYPAKKASSLKPIDALRFE